MHMMNIFRVLAFVSPRQRTATHCAQFVSKVVVKNGGRYTAAGPQQQRQQIVRTLTTKVWTYENTAPGDTRKSTMKIPKKKTKGQKKKERKEQSRKDKEENFYRNQQKKLRRQKNLHPAAQWKRVISACQYWFSDENMAKDDFMRRTLLRHHGWMPIQTLLTFPKFQHWTNADILVGALSNPAASKKFKVTYCRELVERPQKFNKLTLWDDEGMNDDDDEFSGMDDDFDNDFDADDVDDYTYDGNNNNNKSKLQRRAEMDRWKKEFQDEYDEEKYDDDDAEDEEGDDEEEEKIRSAQLDEDWGSDDEKDWGSKENRGDNGDWGSDGDWDEEVDEDDTSSVSRDKNKATTSTKTAIMDGSNDDTATITPASEAADIATFDSASYHRLDAAGTAVAGAERIAIGSGDVGSVVEQNNADEDLVANDNKESTIVEEYEYDWGDDDDEDDELVQAIDTNGGPRGAKPAVAATEKVPEADEELDERQLMFLQVEADHDENPMYALVRHTKITLQYLDSLERRLREEAAENDDDDYDSDEQASDSKKKKKKQKQDKQKQKSPAATETKATTTKKKSSLPRYKSDRPVFVVSNPNKLKPFCDSLLASADAFAKSSTINDIDHPQPAALQRAIGFDVEYCTLEMDIRGNLPAMIQMASPDPQGPVGLIWIDKFPNHGRDIMKDPSCKPLQDIFGDPTLRKVGVRVTGDATNLARWFGAKNAIHIFSGLSDLEVVDGGARLSEMSEKVLGRRLPKIKELGARKKKDRKRKGFRVPTAHWRRADLTPIMREYAANDASCGVDIWLKKRQQEASAAAASSTTLTSSSSASSPL